MSALPQGVWQNQDKPLYYPLSFSTVSVKNIRGWDAVFSSITTAGSFNAGTISASVAYLSTISTTNITLDGNTLNTGGAGFGATLLLNGVPIATTANLSSISEWAYDPAISTVQMDGNDLVNARNIDGVNLTVTNSVSGVIGGFTTLNSGNITNTSNILTNTIQTTGLINAASVSTTNLKANVISTGTVNVSTLLGVTAVVGNINTNAISTQTLSVASAATFAGSRPNFTTGINTSGANNFNNTTLDNVGRITANTVFIGSPNYVEIQTSSFTSILNNRGADIGGNSVIDLKSRFGAATRVNITADASSALSPTPTQIVSITANGATSLTQNPIGGRVSIVANAGSGTACNILGFGEVDITAYSSAPFPGVIKESAGSILAYSGVTVPAVGVPGCSFYSALACLSLTAGATPATTSFPGVVLLRGDNGTKVVNGFFSDTIEATGNSVLPTITTNGLTAPVGSNLAFFATSQNIQFNSATVGFNANIAGAFSVSTITNLSSINGSAYPPASGSGVWASTATTALNMNGFSINGVSSISGNSNLRILGTVFTSNTSNWTNGSVNTLYGSEVLAAKYIQWSYDNNPGTGIYDNCNIRIDAPNIAIQGALSMCNNSINNIYQLNFSNSANIDGAYPNQLNFNASNSYFLGNLRFYGSGRTLDIADNIIQNVTTLYGSSGGFLTINAANGMVIENNQGARIALNTNADIELRTLSTAQIVINQTAGSDFILFNNGDTRMLAKRDAYLQGERDTYLLANQNMNIRAPDTQYITIQQSGTGNQSFLQFQPSGVIDQFSRLHTSIRTLSTNYISIEQQGAGNQSYIQLRPDGNTVINSRNYIELAAQQGSNGIYLTGSFTELRGYLTFNAVNNYINNLEAIYGDASAPGGGLAINSMYGLFFNSSGKNANLYIDSGNLNMINFNSGINIANYNAYGTGNISLFTQNNEVYITSQNRTVTINAATGVTLNSGGASISIASDNNIYFSANGTAKYANFQNTNVVFNTGTPGSLELNMNGNKITNVSSITSAGELSITATTNILTSAVSTINTVQNTYFSESVSRRLDGVGVLQPIIQYGEISTSGSSGNTTVTIPTRYGSATSYVAFASMEDTNPAQIAINRDTRNQITIYWANAGGGSHTIVWQTIGT